MEFLHSLWLSRVDSRASAIAVQDSTGAYTYEQLEKRSAEWFELLKDKGVCVGHRIMFVADTSFEAIAALIGCSMAGGFFSVVSPEVPKSRRDGIQIEFSPNIVIEDEINTGNSCEESSIFGRFESVRNFVCEVYHSPKGVSCPVLQPSLLSAANWHSRKFQPSYLKS